MWSTSRSDVRSAHTVCLCQAKRAEPTLWAPSWKCLLLALPPSDRLSDQTGCLGAGIARWLCVGLALLFDAESLVRSSSEEIFTGGGHFSLGVNMGSDSIPTKLFRIRV